MENGPDRARRPGRARRHRPVGPSGRSARTTRSGGTTGDDARSFRLRPVRDRFLVVRWVIVAVWAVLLVVRVVVASHHPEMDLALFGFVEVGAIVLGLAVIALGLRHAWVTRLRRADEALGLAIRRIDPTVWLVQATPTEELRAAIAEAKPEIVLGRRVTWAFGATEASLWELDDRKATRVLVVRWRRVVHVGLEDVRNGRRVLPAVVVHHVRADEQPAVATFFVRRGPGSTAITTDRDRLAHLVSTLAAERVVA